MAKEPFFAPRLVVISAAMCIIGSFFYFWTDHKHTFGGAIIFTCLIILGSIFIGFLVDKSLPGKRE